MSDDPAKTRILPNAPAGELPVGAELSSGMYRVTGRIAAGGFGITYEARDNLERKVAIKECFPAGLALRAGDFTVSAASTSTAEPFETARTLFLREARTLAALRHPNIVHVQTLFEENGTAYMAMDYIDGRDLQHVIQHEPDLLTPTYIMELTRALLGALDYLHRDAPERGKERLLHRDIKPANIRIDPLDTPVIIDFGAARQETKAQSRAAGTFRVVSDGYSPNEFYVAGTEQGPASDLYSLAATLYHCISAAAPAPADERAQKVSNGEADPYVPIAGRFPAHDPRLLELIDRALSRPLRERPQDASAWFAAIPDATTRIIASTPAPAVSNAPAPATRSVWIGAALAGVTALALVGAGLYALRKPPATDAELRQDLAAMETELAEMTRIADGLQSDMDAATDARDVATRRADDLTTLVTDLRAQLDAEEQSDAAQTTVLRRQLNQAMSEQSSAEEARRALAQQVQDLETQMETLEASGPDAATLITLEAERTAALAQAEAATRTAERARADLARMAADLTEAEAEATQLRMDLRTTRAEMDLMIAGATLPNPAPNPAPNPGPNSSPSTPTCPSRATPGTELRYTGTEAYSGQTLTAQAGGATNLSTCAGLPATALGVVSSAPSYTLHLSEMAQFRRLELQVTSECDTTLLVNSADGAWHFDDNSNDGTAPLLNISGPQAIDGRLDLWIGTADGSSCAASLELETWLN